MNFIQMKLNAQKSIKTAGFSAMVGYTILGVVIALSKALRNSGNKVLMVLGIVVELCSIFVSTGFIWYCLEVSRNEMPNLSTIFNGFAHAGKVFVLSLMVAVRVILWGLLLIVPGVIKAYSYSMSFYLLHDHPEWTPSQCIDESQRIMKGHKGNLFELQLSFIGWALLGGIVAPILLAILSSFLPTILVYVVSYLVLAPLEVYIYVTQANFYNEVVRKSMYNM